MIQHQQQVEREAVEFKDYHIKKKDAFMKHISEIERQEEDNESESSSSVWESFPENEEGDLQIQQPVLFLSGIKLSKEPHL